MISLTIDSTAAEQRLDRYLRKYLKKHPEIKLWDIYHWIRKGIVKVDWRKRPEKFWLQDWHVVEIHTELNETAFESLTTKKEKKQMLSPKDFQHMILYESEDYVVFNKPAGIVMHPGQKHNTDLTMNDYLQAYYDHKETKISETFSPAFCFRLDKDTSGIVIWGLTYEAVKWLNDQIRERSTDKMYNVLVNWRTPEKIRMDQSLYKYYDRKFDRSQVKVDRHKGIKALSHLTTLRHFSHNLLGAISFCEVKLVTWRLHQIRAHCAHAWFPVMWDIVYGLPATNRLMYKKLQINRQLLHCHKYTRRDTSGKKVTVTSEVGKDFETLMK